MFVICSLEPIEFVHFIVYFLSFLDIVGIPCILPVSLIILKPLGNLGDIIH